MRVQLPLFSLLIFGFCGSFAVAATDEASLSSASLPRTALVPNAVSFFDAAHGVLATGYRYCASRGCRPSGTVSLTSDGGKSWRVVLHTPRPVVSVVRFGGGRVVYVQYDDGTTLRSSDRGATWQPAVALTPYAVSVCPQGMTTGINTQAYGRQSWALCTSQPGAGNEAKAVYRLESTGWVRVSSTSMVSGRSSGGISSYGYPLGIAGADHDFAVIWESRGTLYVTRDGGHRWLAQPKVAQPELDFGQWAYVLPRGRIGFALLAHGGQCPCRLIETTDAGRTWHVRHRWTTG